MSQHIKLKSKKDSFVEMFSIKTLRLKFYK
jgi:hypothetical protein